jgi:TldD protein
MEPLLDPKIAENIINHALRQGADFCDIFIERKNHLTFKQASRQLDSINSGIDFGLGIRLIYGSEVYYGTASTLDELELLKIVSNLKSTASPSKEKLALPFIKTLLGSDLGSSLKNEDWQEKIEFLSGMDKQMRSLSEKLVQVNLNLAQSRQEVQIYNSEGLNISDLRNYVRLSVTAIAEDGNLREDAYEAPGATMDMDFIRQLDSESLGEKVISRALRKLSAIACPAGKMPVILENAFGGVIFHEACGHLLETTSVQRRSSVFWDKMNQQIANSAVTAVDDGTIADKWGSIRIDDEGRQTKRTELIVNGVLKNFLVDYVGHLKTQYPLSASARRESYRYAPASRMRNTFICPGSFSRDELISSIDYGLYAESLGGGSVIPGTGEFNFAVNSGYLIENGKLTKPVKGATLIGTGPEILQRISMVGKELELAAGMCGSVSGSVPVTVGQPPLKVDEILVGGELS